MGAIDYSSLRKAYEAVLNQRFPELKGTMTPLDALRTLDEMITAQNGAIPKPATSARPTQNIVDRILASNSYIHYFKGYDKDGGYNHRRLKIGKNADTSPFESQFLNQGESPGELIYGVPRNDITAKHSVGNFGNDGTWGKVDRENNQNHFLARVFGNPFEDSYLIQLTYLDPTGNTRSRHGIPFTYSLIVPKEEVPIVVPTIKSNPEILIELFTKVFPGLDKSTERGKKLEIDRSHVHFEGV